MKTEVYKVQPLEDLAKVAARGIEALRAGGLVAFPTETVYGVAANAANAQTMERLRELKDRPVRPFTVHIGRFEQVYRYVANPPQRAQQLMRKAWPGPVTVVLPVPGRLADPTFGDDLAARLCYEDTIALRCPAHPISELMLGEFPDPVVAPSANLAGQRPPTRPEDVLQDLDGRIDLLIDAGPTRWAKESTIVAFDQKGALKLLRQGVYDQRIIDRMMQRRILFVCSGNTCRSPMAAAIARAELARALGCRESELADRGWQVISAGTMGMGGLPAAPEAAEAVKELGADVGKHRSQPLSVELINLSDLIFCMAGHHLEEVVNMVPSASGRTYLLDAQGDIPDPVGSGLKTYQQVARRIQSGVRARLSEMLK